jgi:hypothetical protein
MFICQGCEKQMGHGVKMTRFPVETRGKPYMEHRSRAVGYRIVKEIGVCPECAMRLKKHRR